MSGVISVCWMIAFAPDSTSSSPTCEEGVNHYEEGLYNCEEGMNHCDSTSSWPTLRPEWQSPVKGGEPP